MDDSKLTNLAKDFVESFAPGHDYAVFIHRDTGHPHAHVLWNSVNFESGKKFHSSKKDLYRAVEIKNSLDEKYGLEITPGFGEKSQKLDFVRDRELRKFERDPFEYSWKEDLKTRISGAKDQSETFEDYLASLKKLDVEPVLRGKKEPKLTYKFIDQDGKQRRIRETSLGQNYTREKIKNEIESRSLKLHEVREVSRESDRKFETRPAGLQQDIGSSFVGIGEGIGGQEVDHRGPRIDISASFGLSRLSGPDLEEIARILLESSYGDDRKTDKRYKRESLELDRRPTETPNDSERFRGRELGSRTERGQDERISLPVEITDISDSLSRYNPNLGSGGIHGLVDPETVLKLKSWRKENAGYLREQGKPLLRGRGNTKSK